MYNKNHSETNVSITAPQCPTPPPVPYEGKVTNNPVVFDLEKETSCGVDSKSFDISCFSFMSIYVQTAYFGRKKKLNKKQMCNGNEGI